MEKIFSLLYTLLMLFLYIIALPLLLIISLKDKYRQSIPARFFLWQNSRLKPNGIWFHSCSFGEAKAIKPIVDTLPQELLRMTTTTNTGYKAIQEYTTESQYLPFEWLLWFWTTPQKALVVMEAEFWYLLFALARSRGAKIILINARMSDRSYHKYYKIRWFYKKIFNNIDEVFAQTQKDAQRLESLGAKNITITGNIKLSKLSSPTQNLTKPSGLILCGASTHEGEEELILKAFDALCKDEPNTKLIIVPRHPERFEKVNTMIEEFATSKYTTQRYSQNQSLTSDIILVDTLGELVNIYAISDIVILGGAFAPIGGHNAGEPAQFGCKIISGKHYFNQRDIFQAIEGITIVEDFNLTKRVLQHGLLKPCRIKQRSDISAILESLIKYSIK
ncbi:MAG: lipid IV(A) 3-deoxy-D-manno-octulosonic acid transferase [Sulfurovum sp.]